MDLPARLATVLEGYASLRNQCAFQLSAWFGRKEQKEDRIRKKIEAEQMVYWFSVKVAAETIQYRFSAVRVIIIVLSVVRNGRLECSCRARAACC